MDEYGAGCGYKIAIDGMYRDGRPYTPSSSVIWCGPTSSTSNIRPVPKPQKRTTYLVVDSRDRDPQRHPTPTSYVIALPDTLHNVSCARLLSAEIPTSFYVFTAARNNTTITVVFNGVVQDVTIPDGNYGFSSMASALEDALLAAFGTAFTVEFDTVTLKCTIAAEAGDTVAVDTLSLTSTAATQWGLAYYLGFDRDVRLEGTGSVTSPRVCTMNPENYVVLECEELGTVMEASADGVGGHASRRVFAKIPITVGTGATAFYDKVITANEQRPHVAKLASLRLAWRFHDGTPVDFNGVEHSLTLELEHEPGRSNQ